MWQGERCSAPLSAPALWVLCALGLALYFFPLPHRARYWGGRIFAASAPSPPPPPACPPGATRNQFDAAALQARGVRLVVGESGELRFPHSLVDAECPRYIVSLQDMSAGIGHRTREWATSLWLALTFNLTLVHRPVDFALEGARREHGGYEGWDAFLGLAIGEQEGEPAGEDVTSKLLPSIGKWGAPTESVRALWAPHLTAPDSCNVVFIAPGDQAPRDISAAVRPYMTWKFAAAAASRALSGNETLTLRYDPTAVTIAVHFRVGDIVPTPEAALWANTRLALSSLRAEGVVGAMHVHVHTDGPVALAHFGVAALLEDEGEGGVVVWHHYDMSASETMWHLANADVLVGSQSGFSWLAGLLSPRSLALLQRGSQWHETCADEGTAVCCTGGVCEEAGTEVLELASQRIAAAQACGDFGPHSSVFTHQWDAMVDF